MLSFLTNNHRIVMLSFLKQVGDRLELMGKLRPKFGSVFFRLLHHSYVKFFVSHSYVKFFKCLLHHRYNRSTLNIRGCGVF